MATRAEVDDAFDEAEAEAGLFDAGARDDFVAPLGGPITTMRDISELDTMSMREMVLRGVEIPEWVGSAKALSPAAARKQKQRLIAALSRSHLSKPEHAAQVAVRRILYEANVPVQRGDKLNILRDVPGICGYQARHRQLHHLSSNTKDARRERAILRRLIAAVDNAHANDKRAVFTAYIRRALKEYYLIKNVQDGLSRSEKRLALRARRRLIAGICEERDLFLLDPVIADYYRHSRWTILGQQAPLVCGPLGTVLGLEGYLSDEE